MVNNFGSSLTSFAPLDRMERQIDAAAAVMPLIGERMRITIRGGLALVSREQIFRNAEDRTIEATITFPVPVHATLHRLTAKIGGRILTAEARPRHQARDAYERAVDDGRTAVLHEERLRGVHMLSIAHIPPGAEIAVTHAWIAAMSPRDAGEAFLRVPVTVGDIYGDSPFTDADDLAVSRSVLHRAEIEIDSGDAVARIAGSTLVDGKTTRILDAPIDVEVSGIAFGPAYGVSADGRSVSVTVVPDTGGDDGIEAAILVDRSGSMNGTAFQNSEDTRASWLTKLQAITQGLFNAGRELRQADRTELWQFDNEVERLSQAGAPLIDALKRLGEPRGGTEIGKALTEMVATSSAPDIILITDGLSHALDVQALANSGRRFTVVLVGPDSFEANVGRLAAMTGGQIIVVADQRDATGAMRSALASVRRPKPAAGVENWPLARAALYTAGAVVQAEWRDGAADTSEFGKAVGALAAAIALPRLAEDQAMDVAASHGLVCHLTSLVLVDEAGAVQDGLPAQYKVPLMESRQTLRETTNSFSLTSARFRIELRETPTVLPRFPRYPREALSEMAREIDWGAYPEALRRGDLTAVPPGCEELIFWASHVPEVVSLADGNRSAIAIVLALMARFVAGEDRAAARIARTVLAGLDETSIAKAAAELNLIVPPVTELR